MHNCTQADDDFHPYAESAGMPFHSVFAGVLFFFGSWHLSRMSFETLLQSRLITALRHVPLIATITAAIRSFVTSRV
jgi:hypothetical protein